MLCIDYLVYSLFYLLPTVLRLQQETDERFFTLEGGSCEFNLVAVSASRTLVNPRHFRVQKDWNIFKYFGLHEWSDMLT